MARYKKCPHCGGNLIKFGGDEDDTWYNCSSCGADIAIDNHGFSSDLMSFCLGTYQPGYFADDDPYGRPETCKTCPSRIGCIPDQCHMEFTPDYDDED